MSILQDKKIILAVSGSIAAYKSAVLVRQFIKAGAEVKVLMTPSAKAFVNPLTFSTLSKNPVLEEVIDANNWNNHVELGLWADAMVIAPSTANTMAKLANGICDNMVAAVYLSARCPVFLAPAMDVDMWKHPATLRNLQLLESYGHHILQVGHGELASGLIGEGRMAEPEDIVQDLEQYFAQKNKLSGIKVLITAGPTYEPIDPVRFIGNRSSGKMGVALAKAAKRLGAKETLILGPSSEETHGLNVIRVETAQEMFDAVEERFNDAHVIILAAAVSDYRPKEKAREKIKKQESPFIIETIRTPDIAAHFGQLKSPEQITIGFALETENEELHAKAKLQKKNFDFIVLNSLKDEGAGFGHETNKVQFFFQDGSQQDWPLKTKSEVAMDIMESIVHIFRIKKILQ